MRKLLATGCLLLAVVSSFGQNAAANKTVKSTGESPVSTRASSRRDAGATAGITRAQADAILGELRKIRQLLEADPGPTTAAQFAAPSPRTGSPASTQAAKAKMAVAAGWFVLGTDAAPVTLVEFGDYQCPFCRRFHSETFAELKKQYIDTGKVRFVSRDFPLSFHPNAMPAAQAARCAAEQGRFWELRGAMLEHADKLDAESIAGYATAAGLDAAALKTCVDSGKYKAAIEKDAAEAMAIGITGTPGFLVARTSATELEGEIVAGAMPLAWFDAAIQKLAAPAALKPTDGLNGAPSH